MLYLRQGKPIKLTKHTEIPDDVLVQRGPTKRQKERKNDVGDKVEAIHLRVKGESLEEKKARKQAIKELRRVK